MSSEDTRTEAVERMAHHAHKLLMGTTLDPLVAATLRALAAERDALRDDLLTLEICQAKLLETCQAKLVAERDRLAAERDALREALVGLMTWFPDRLYWPEWRLPGGKYGADDAVAAARAALAQKEPGA